MRRSLTLDSHAASNRIPLGWTRSRVRREGGRSRGPQRPETGLPIRPARLPCWAPRNDTNSACRRRIRAQRRDTRLPTPLARARLPRTPKRRAWKRRRPCRAPQHHPSARLPNEAYSRGARTESDGRSPPASPPTGPACSARAPRGSGPQRDSPRRRNDSPLHSHGWRNECDAAARAGSGMKRIPRQIETAQAILYARSVFCQGGRRGFKSRLPLRKCSERGRMSEELIRFSSLTPPPAGGTPQHTPTAEVGSGRSDTSRVDR
jgi:hypothetical protein